MQRVHLLKRPSSIASRYARAELMYEIMKRPFDSTGLDKLLMGLPVGVSTLEDFLPFLAEQDDSIDQLRSVVKGTKRNRQLGQEAQA